MTQDTLTHLGLLYSPNAQHIFVALSDNKHGRGSQFIYKCFKGTLDSCVDKLTELNSKGAGIFVQVNRDHMRGFRRLEHNVAEATNIFLDFDSPTLPQLPFEPSLVVRTRRGYHVWISIFPTKDLEGWTRVVKHLAANLGADTACTSRNQLARLAGFQHMKGEPFMIAIESHSPKRYNLSDIEEIVGQIPLSPAPPAPQMCHLDGIPELGTFPFPLLRHILRKSATKVKNGMSGSGGVTLIRQAWHLGHFLPYGLPFALAQEALLRAANLGKDADAKRLVQEAILDGCRDSAVNPPYIPNEVREAALRKLGQDECIRSVLSDVGDEVVIADLLSLADWSDWFDSAHHLRRAIALSLKGVGYSFKKCKRRGDYVSLWYKPVT